MSTKVEIRRCDDCVMRSEGVLAGVPEEVFADLSCGMTMHRFPARHRAFLEGNPCDQVASVRKGLVKLSKIGPNGRTQVLGVVGPGFLLGCESLRGAPCQCTAEAITPVELCMATRDEIDGLMRRSPDVAVGVVSLLSHRIDDLERTALRLGTYSGRQRLAALLLSTDLSHSDPGNGSAGLSRQELADTLGMAKETLIRLLTQFVSRGLIETEGRAIRVLEPDALRRMLLATG